MRLSHGSRGYFLPTVGGQRLNFSLNDVHFGSAIRCMKTLHQILRLIRREKGKNGSDLSRRVRADEDLLDLKFRCSKQIVLLLYNQQDDDKRGKKKKKSRLLNTF